MLCKITPQQFAWYFGINLPGHCVGKSKASFNRSISAFVVYGEPFDIGAERAVVTCWLHVDRGLHMRLFVLLCSAERVGEL
jgi:hypothetical protein